MASSTAEAPAMIAQDADAEATAPRPKNSFPIVGVGASAGGLEAFKQLLSALPDQPGMAFVLVPHLDPTHESAMRELLSLSTKLPVLTVEHGMRVEVDHVYVIPPNTEMTISDSVLQLSERQTGELAMPIDTFFRSLAEDQPSNAIGIILSGTGSDGSLGITAIKGEGGIAFAQDSESAKYEDMPYNAVATGCVDFVLPPAGIASELGRIRNHPFITKAPTPVSFGDGSAGKQGFARLFTIVNDVSHVDFSGYKQATINRRILRRMALQKIDTLSDYVRYLDRNREEAEALYQDFLIDVTRFFRNPEAFEMLKQTAFPALLKDRAANETIRVWVPGCSSGEEAYSHAIGWLEYLTEIGAEFPLQIFGTDVSESGIKKARLGIFPESISADVSPARLRRFFSKVEQGYQISKSVRDVCIFAQQNVLTDAPFSRMDLVSCRNLLIYLGPELQKRLIPVLHYALKPNGYLMLGTTEGLVGNGAELFEVADGKNRIYRKKPGRSPVLFGMAVEKLDPRNKHPRTAVLRPLSIPHNAEDVLKQADRFLLDKFVPAAVVVTENLDIAELRGNAGRFFQFSHDTAKPNLQLIINADLASELRKAVETAKTSNRLFVRQQFPIATDGHNELVDLEVSPIRTALRASPMYLIAFRTFRETGPHARPRKGPKPENTKLSRDTTGEQEIQRLRDELSASNERLQSVLEKNEADTEQLQSANEEIQSANEELQSANEQLQTSKEELESNNEELKTVNEEMQNRNRQLTRLANDLTNVWNSVNIPIVMLGPELAIIHFTPQAAKAFGLIASDEGKRISDVRLRLDANEIERRALEVMGEAVPKQFSIRGDAGIARTIRITPYRTSENKIEGVVLTIVDWCQESATSL